VENVPRVLLIETHEGRMAALGTRLRALGFSPLWAKSAEEALATVSNPAWHVSAVVMPPDLPAADLSGALRVLRERAASGRLPIAVEGRPPNASGLETLRGAGVDLALWEPYDDALLRFQMNRALAAGADGPRRQKLRVPSGFRARVSVGGRAKDATVYCLSETGCFLETPRPTLPGARVEISIPRLAGESPLAGRVVFTNVPGNLQRPNLPLGMAVAFQPLPEHAALQVQRYVEDRGRTIGL